MRGKLLKVILLISLLILFFSFEADFIICTINDTPVTYIQFIRELNRYKIALKAQGQNISENVKEIVFNNILEITLVIQEAKKQGISVSEEEVKFNINSIKKRYGMSDEQFIQQLKMEGFTYQEFINNYKNQMIQYRFINSYIKNLISKPDEKEIEQFYNENKEKFKGSIKYDVIVFCTDLHKDAKLFDKLKAKKILQKFYNEITLDNYSGILSKYNKENKIKIKSYSKIIYPEIEDKNFVVALNNYSNENKTSIFFYNNDYYFFLIKNKVDINYIPLKDLKEKITNYIEQKKIQDAYKKWIENKKKEAIIKWFRKDVIYQ